MSNEFVTNGDFQVTLSNNYDISNLNTILVDRKIPQIGSSGEHMMSHQIFALKRLDLCAYISGLALNSDTVHFRW